MYRILALSSSLMVLSAFTAPADAAPKPAPAPLSGCGQLPSPTALKEALTAARKENNGGLNNDMWGVTVDRSGIVCAVVYTGATVDSQWPGSRIIAATKANTANALSLKGSALSTANLYSGVQPGGFLYGLANTHPVDIGVAYKGPAGSFGSAKDPMVGHYVGGITTFGGGLPLYDAKGDIVGGFGVSGDTACADHNIAWRARTAIKLDYVPSGMSSDKNDQIIYDISDGKSKSGFGHPECGGKEKDVMKDLSAVRHAGAAE